MAGAICADLDAGELGADVFGADDAVARAPQAKAAPSGAGP